MRRKLPAAAPLLAALLLLPTGARAAKSRVHFLSNPPGVTVTDANLGELGTTPFRLDLKRKTALVCTFSKPGYESKTVSQVVGSLRTEVRADLVPLPMATVRLDVVPRGASVKLSAPDGTEIYAGESGRVHTLPGQFWDTSETATFRLEAWAPGYRPIDQEIVLTNHQSHDLSLPLAEVTTLLSVSSEPEGVLVSSHFLGSLGRTPLESRVSLVDLLRARSRQNAAAGDPSRIVVTFSKPGYRTRASQIALDFEREENPVTVSLEPLGGD